MNCIQFCCHQEDKTRQENTFISSTYEIYYFSIIRLAYKHWALNLERLSCSIIPEFACLQQCGYSILTSLHASVRFEISDDRNNECVDKSDISPSSLCIIIYHDYDCANFHTFVDNVHTLTYQFYNNFLQFNFNIGRKSASVII